VSELGAPGPVKRVQIEAVVIRADGTRIDLGRVADSSRWWRFGLGRLLASRRIKQTNGRK
jgi:hypothetical protein